MGRVTWINLAAASLIASYIADAGSHVRFTAVMLTQLLGKTAQKQQRARQNFCESGQHIELLVTNRELQAQNLFDCRSANCMHLVEATMSNTALSGLGCPLSSQSSSSPE